MFGPHGYRNFPRSHNLKCLGNTCTCNMYSVCYEKTLRILNRLTQSGRARQAKAYYIKVESIE